MSTRIYPQDNKATISFDVINRQGDKLAPTAITLKHNKTHEITQLNVADCVDANGLITIDTTGLDAYLYTVTLVYQDTVDNYGSQFMFMIDNR